LIQLNVLGWCNAGSLLIGLGQLAYYTLGQGLKVAYLYRLSMQCPTANALIT